MKNLKENLSLTSTAIGSLPHNSAQAALDLIFSTPIDIPFWPQLSKVSPKEDMIIQLNENIPGLKFDEENNKLFFDTESEEFFLGLEEFFEDYEKITTEKNFDLLEKYAISDKFACSIHPFFGKIKETKPLYAKGHVTGPFSWGVSICDPEKKAAFYDETLRDIIIKALTLKALWQVINIKKASPKTTPIIFLDEPTLSQYGTSAFLTVTKEDITTGISEISQVLRDNGALIGVHCCGKTNWSLITDSEVDILNFDGYFFGESLSAYSKEIDSFLKKGGFIAWGMIPTLDPEALEKEDLNSLLAKFEADKNYLLKNGIDEKQLLSQSIITPSCGAGVLSEELAQKAIRLTKELSDVLKNTYGGTAK